MGPPIKGEIALGISLDGQLVGGLEGQMTTFKIFYLSVLFVEENYRRKGLGRALIEEMEERAKAMGANTIRLDTFGFQGKEFYASLGYEEVGYYHNKEDDYEEYFFVKRL